MRRRCRLTQCSTRAVAAPTARGLFVSCRRGELEWIIGERGLER